MTRRINRLVDTTFFDDDDAGALKQARLSIARTNGANAAITTTFKSAETRSAADSTDLPTLLSKVYSRLDGPRTDVGDTTIFYLSRWGAPDTVVNALGQRTRVVRDTLFPALVARSIAPTGFEQRAYYNARALVDSSVALNPYGDLRNAKTSYVWHSTLSVPLQITAPTGEQTSFGYLPNALTEWRQIGNDPARRDSVLYRYNWQVGATVDQFRNRDSVFYDALGNTARTKTPLGFGTVYVRDGLGRDTLVLTPIDSAQTDSLRQRTVYDAMDRVIESTTLGGSQSLVVRHGYDVAGQLKSVSRRDPNITDIDSLRTQFRYDAAGRKVAEVAADGRVDSTVYDGAGNVTRVINRNLDWVSMEYDELNRLTTRITPAKGVPTETLNELSFPRHATSIPADTAVFVYDSTGLIAANNGDARITHLNNRNGTLREETQRIRTWVGNDFDQHVYTVGWNYDLVGRRTTLKRFNDADSVHYGYSPETGLLDTIVDGNKFFTYQRDLAGRLLQLAGTTNGSSSTGVVESFAYDADGRLQRRTETSAFYSGSAATLHADTLGYGDGRGLITSTRTKLDTVHTEYAPLGAVSRSDSYDRSNWVSTPEVFTTDAFGNMRTKNGVGPLVTFSYEGTTGRLISTQRSGWSGDATTYDSVGNTVVFRKITPVSPGYVFELTRSYYDAASRLRIADRRGVVVGQGVTAEPDLLGAFEEYRYDALGRRVLKRSRRKDCEGPCQSAIERYIWDGDNLLKEIRRPGRDSIPNDSLEVDYGYISITYDSSTSLTDTVWVTQYSPYYGAVVYTHGPEIDRPLLLRRYDFGQDSIGLGSFEVALHYNWRGVVDEGTLWSGSRIADQGYKVEWPGADVRLFGDRSPSGVPLSWVGSLTDGMRDASGLQYRRNRYYDPGTGRFTQEDPIGLAGGMNLYGFAGGDPINFADPFGLSADPVYGLVVAGRSALQVGGQALAATSAALAVTADAIGTVVAGTVEAAIQGINDLPTSGGLHRPYIRQSTRFAVEKRSPQTADGRFIDANTGQPINGSYDLGHKPGHEFRREKALAEAQGLTQKQFNERMNNPDLYEVESPSSNRSRRYEKKP